MSASPTRAILVPVTVAALLVVQALVLYLPEAPGPPSSLPNVDKLVHAAVFASPVLVAGLARRGWWPVVALCCLLHAPVSELVQHLLLPARSGDVRDVVADLVGVATASLAVSWWSRRPRRRRH